MLSIPSYALIALTSPWYEFATILAIATLPVAVLIILTKLMQRQRRLRVALPWFVSSCHFIGPLLFEEIADPSEAGDGILGLTYQGLVAMYAVLPASLIGSLMGGVLGCPSER